MTESFDISASSYDNVFTNSHIGKLQRELVYNFLKNTLPENQKLDILEINCGTGHDAIWLTNQGHCLIATDISSEMISIATAKLTSTDNQPEFRQLDINKLDQTEFEHSFDLIFSDFGGLNCLSPTELENFFLSANKKLKPNGKIIGVIMPKYCIIENLYFMVKGNLKKAFRRNTNEVVIANVEGTAVKTWYYNPKHIIKKSNPLFKVNRIRPIGFFIPPSYLGPFFKNKKGLLKVLGCFDAIFKRFAFLSRYSDHYIISLSKR
ncbi:class I SAM-dependent methyltransferase [Aquimarina sp. M1]